MKNGFFNEDLKVLAGLTPSADLYNGDPATDIVNMAGYTKCVFVLHQVQGSTSIGSAVITVEAVDNAAGSNALEIPFTYRKKTTGTSEVWGSITAALAAGFTTTVAEDTMYIIEIDHQALPEAQQWVRMVMTEAVDSPVLGSVAIYLDGARYKDPNHMDALA